MRAAIRRPRGELHRAGEDGVDHRHGQLPGEGVLLARVEAAEQGEALAQRRFGAVAEPWLRARGGDADRARRAEEAVPAELAEGDDDAGTTAPPSVKRCTETLASSNRPPPAGASTVLIWSRNALANVRGVPERPVWGLRMRL